MPKLTYPKKKEKKVFHPLANYDIGKQTGANQMHDTFTAYLREALSDEKIKEVFNNPANRIKNPNRGGTILEPMMLLQALRKMVGI